MFKHGLAFPDNSEFHGVFAYGLRYFFLYPIRKKICLSSVCIKSLYMIYACLFVDRLVHGPVPSKLYKDMHELLRREARPVGGLLKLHINLNLFSDKSLTVFIMGAPSPPPAIR